MWACGITHTHNVRDCWPLVVPSTTREDVHVLSDGLQQPIQKHK